jgi:transcriptional regulator with XRE-family HTH domain
MEEFERKYTPVTYAKSLFGSYIRKQRVLAGLSLRQVADEMCFTHVEWGRVECGKMVLKRTRWARLVQTVPTVSFRELISHMAVIERLMAEEKADE